MLTINDVSDEEDTLLLRMDLDNFNTTCVIFDDLNAKYLFLTEILGRKEGMPENDDDTTMHVTEIDVDNVTVHQASQILVCNQTDGMV